MQILFGLVVDTFNAGGMLSRILLDFHVSELALQKQNQYSAARDFCITQEEKEQRIKELKQLNLSIAYSSSTLHFFWQNENMLSYKRDQVYDMWDMIGKKFTNNIYR